MILDGKKVAKEVYDALQQSISQLPYTPHLHAILVGENSPSMRYIKQKQKWAEYIWMQFTLHHFEENITENELLKCINWLNTNNWVDGFIVQLPLPSHIDEKTIIHAIAPEKDVDGFHPVNQWKIVIWDTTGLQACTPAGMMELLKYYKIDPKWKNVVIIGRSNIVGKPIANLLINAQATVTVCNSQTKNIEFFTKNADIVITALGKPHFLTYEKISPHAIVIDVWFSVVDGKILWDADFENIEKHWNMITPVPGWVGSLTVAMLLNNTFLAYQRKKK